MFYLGQDCKVIRFQECKEFPEYNCQKVKVHTPDQKLVHRKKCLLPDNKPGLYLINKDYKNNNIDGICRISYNTKISTWLHWIIFFQHNHINQHSINSLPLPTVRRSLPTANQVLQFIVHLLNLLMMLRLLPLRHLSPQTPEYIIKHSISIYLFINLFLFIY